MLKKRVFLTTLASLVSLAYISPAYAAPKLLTGVAADWTISASGSTAKSRTGENVVISGYDGVRFTGDIWHGEGGKWVPPASWAGAAVPAPAPVSDPSAYNRGWNDALSGVVLPGRK